MSIRRLMSAAIVAICVLVPAIEAFDRWDETLRDGNDTEATVVIAAVCVGFALSFGTTALIARLRAVLAGARVCFAAVPTSQLAATGHVHPLATDSSPPVTLRI
ncbi:MAG TPA: hypothetical protein VIR54_05805 [Vicinamibacterales bacterium]